MASSSDVRDTTPDKVDMRRFLWPIEDMGEIYASSSNAAGTALEYHCNRMDEEPTNLSTMFIHYNARLSSGQENANKGTTIAAAMDAIRTYGACRESTWPFDPAKLTVKPPAQAYEEAKKFAGVRLAYPLDLIQALSLSYPVPFAAKLPRRCLDEAGGARGVMPAPTVQELQKPDAWVNHAMVIVGYDKIAKTFLVRNCWGTEWGDKGHCTVSFDIMKVIAPEGQHRLWIIMKKEAPKTDQAASAPGFRPAERPTSTAAAAAQPERLADLAAKMREEIRGDVQRDLADATKRIRDMMGRNPAAAPEHVTPQDICPSCGGTKRCPQCGGRGCNSCSYGSCPRCGGRGVV